MAHSEESHNGIAAVLKTADRKVVGVRVPLPPQTDELHPYLLTNVGEMHMKAFIFALALLSFTLVACESGETETPAADSTAVAAPVAAPETAAPVAADSVQ